MAVNFHNPNRSFDVTKNRVQFWGYDSTIEITFFVEGDALLKLCPEMSNVEAGFLKAFDTAITLIHEAANKVYVRSNKGSYAYSLTTKDF